MELPPQAVAGGPRATDRFAAVTAAFVSGLAGTARAVEVTAFFLESVAARLEEAVRVGLTWKSKTEESLEHCSCMVQRTWLTLRVIKPMARGSGGAIRMWCRPICLNRDVLNPLFLFSTLRGFWG